MFRRSLVLFVTIVLIAAGILLYQPPSVVEREGKKEGETARVIRVIDGDTIEVDLDGEARKVRYLGIDSPERDECFAKEATEKNTSLVEGKYVRLESDQPEEDMFGRLLRYVFLDSENIFVNDFLVKEGYAKFYDSTRNYKYQPILSLSEQNAREGKKGLWFVCKKEDIPPYYPD